MPRKIDDIIEFEIKIDINIPKEDLESGKVIDVSDYKRDYEVSYSVNGNEESISYSLSADEGTCCIEDNIKDLIKDEMTKRYKEVTDYEIFDVYNDYDNQSAKVRIKSVRN